LDFSRDDISQLAKGNQSAYSKLLKVYGQKTYNLVYYHLQNREEAEEVTQDVFIKVIRKSASFKHQSKFDTWIYRLAVNESLDRIRYHQRQKRKVDKVPLHALLHSPKSSQANPSEIMQSQENQKRLLDKIEELPERQKTALLLSKMEGKTQKEIGQIMDLSPKAVESLVQRAKSNLKQKLSDYFKENYG
jgi:RNA polymerase sigma-70 factor (ECF subfamily)